jgi:hypothetical protein
MCTSEGIMNSTERFELVGVDDCACSTATAKAILIACEGEEVCVPTSQVHEDSEVYKPGTEGILGDPALGRRDEGAALPRDEAGAMRFILVCMAGCVYGLALAGCMTAHAQTSTITGASLRADENQSI